MIPDSISLPEFAHLLSPCFLHVFFPCYLQHHTKNKNCFVCEKPTQGVFNTAHDIIRRTKEREAAEKEDKEASKKA